MNKTSSLVGCFGDGFSLTNSTTSLYVERHVIYSASRFKKVNYYCRAVKMFLGLDSSQNFRFAIFLFHRKGFLDL